MRGEAMQHEGQPLKEWQRGKTQRERIRGWVIRKGGQGITQRRKGKVMHLYQLPLTLSSPFPSLSHLPVSFRLCYRNLFPSPPLSFCLFFAVYASPQYQSHPFFLSTSHLCSSPPLSAVLPSVLLSLLSLNSLNCALISIMLFYLFLNHCHPFYCPYLFIPLSLPPPFLSLFLSLSCRHCSTNGAWQ